MNSRYALITFDVYTALFDIESSLTPLVSEILQIDGLDFVRAWRRKQLEYALISNSLGQGRISFDLITGSSLDYTLAFYQLSLSESSRTQLLDQWLNLDPWPEARSMLNEIKSRGYTMALLSNGDMSQLQTLAKKLPPVFDHIFSSEQAGYYKPQPSVYALPLDTLHLQANQVLHVAGSSTDALGTKSAGLHCAWSNRKQEPLLDPNLPVDYNMRDLNQLLEIL